MNMIIDMIRQFSFDNRFMKHKLECYHNAYERYKEEAYVFAGPACMETFGETPFFT